VEVVRAALVGAGLIGQVAHLKTMARHDSPIRLAGVVDSSSERASVLAGRYGVPWATSLSELTVELDAVVIAAPDAAHSQLALEALSLGLHVFIEKPLALSVSEAQQLSMAAAHSERVCQVGYMKRFDPSVQRLQSELARRGGNIEGIAIEVRDPDAAPFVSSLNIVPAGAEASASPAAFEYSRLFSTVKEILGRDPRLEELEAYKSFISSLIHDLNLVRLLMPAAIRVEAAFHAMSGAQVGMHLRAPGGGLARISHSQISVAAEYEERMVVYASNAIYEIVFNSPYILSGVTRLRRIDDHAGILVCHVEEFAEVTQTAFELELYSFAEDIVSGATDPRVNGFADAVVDLELVEQALAICNPWIHVTGRREE